MPAVPPAQVARQLAEAMPTRPGGSVDLHLDPRELGAVRITLHSADGTLTALVVAERPETVELMRRHSDVLETALREAGGRAVSVDVSSGGRDSEREARPSAGGVVATEGPAAPARPAAVAARGLDLRL
jgi:flagellar hook-length control protein FliK